MEVTYSVLQIMNEHATSTEDVPQSDYCPYFQHAVELIGRRWTGSILKVLGKKSLRFSELRDRIPGLSDRLLTARLSELETEGVIARSDCEGEIRYSLTPKGLALNPVLDAIASWSHSHPDHVPESFPGRRRC